MSTSPPRRTHDPFVFLGLAAVTVAAAVSSFSALYGVAIEAGWSRAMAPMFPVTIDAAAMVATRIWLAANTPTDSARRYARTVAVGAVLTSLAGNGAYHLTEAGVIHPGVALVIAAGAVPPVALAVVAHLAVLRSAVPAPAEVPVPVAPAPVVPEAVPVLANVPPVSEPKRVAPTRTLSTNDTEAWDDLVTRARQVDARHREAHGRPIGVTKLKTELKVGQSRAQRLRDHLAELPADPPQSAAKPLLPTPQRVSELALANGHTR